MALVHPEGENKKGDVAKIDLNQSSIIPSRKTQSMDPLEEARLASYGTNNSFQNDGAGVMQAAEQYGKSVAFGGQQAQQFFARQYGRPVAPPNSNANNFGNGPLAMDPATMAVVAKELKPEPFKAQEFDIPLSMNGMPGVRGLIDEQSEKIADYMENRNKPKKSYTAVARKLKKQDYANHPNVIEHNENAARKNQ